MLTQSSYTPLTQGAIGSVGSAAARSIHPTGSRMVSLIRLSLHFLIRLFSLGTAKLGTIFTPSFLHRHVSRGERPRESQARQHGISTDWLDGLRGVASFVVFLFHFAIYGHPGIRYAYGADETRKSLIQLPIIRLIVHGRAMVSIFFIVSGYALSFSSLKLIHKQDYDTLLRRLSSSVFRRAIRLMVPSFMSSFAHYLAQRIGLLERREHVSTFWSDTGDFLREFENLISPFDWKARPRGDFYNEHLWTIPVEFRASLILFVTVLGLARSKPGVRMGTLVGLFIYCMSKGRWDVALFMAGICVAESNFLLHQHTTNIDEPTGRNEHRDVEKAQCTLRWISNNKRILRVFSRAGLIGLLLAGCYLASYPTKGAETTREFEWMAGIGPEDNESKTRLWTSLGAVMITTSISLMPRCQAMFETRPAQYLGRISYALYLTHGLMNKLIGKPIVKYTWRIIGKEDWIHYEGAWALGTVVYVPLVIWVADIFWRLLDMWAVDLARSVEQKCLVS